MLLFTLKRRILGTQFVSRLAYDYNYGSVGLEFRRLKIRPAASKLNCRGLYYLLVLVIEGVTMIRIAPVAFLLFFSFVESLPAQDQLPTAAEAASLGLHIQWVATSERFAPNVGVPGAQLWPDREAQDAYIDLHIGSRLVARIEANQLNVDYARYGLYDPSRGDKIGKLGMDGARKAADIIVKQYAVMGRTVVATETVEPKTYLATTSDTGGVQLFDAEKGIRLWSASVGAPNRPTIGPAINDKFIAIANGNQLYILDKNTGNIINQRTLVNSVGAMLTFVEDTVYVPTMNGSIYAYKQDDVLLGEQTIHFSGAARLEPTRSATGKFLSWPIGHYLYTAQVGQELKLWSRLKADSQITSSPIPLTNGLLVTSANGSIIRISYDRTHNLIWRYSCGRSVYEPPIVNGKSVLVTNASGIMVCLDLETGSLLWERLIPGIKHVIAISKTKAYLQDFSGGLFAIRMEDGSAVGRVSRALASGIVNNFSDRIYLRATNGKLMCLRENESLSPEFFPVVAVMRGSAPENAVATNTEEIKELKENDAVGFESMTEPSTPTDNPFGESNPFGGSSPFGGESAFGPAAGDDSNPFGS